MFIEFLRVLFCEMIFGVEMAAATEPLAGRPWRRVGALGLDPRSSLPGSWVLGPGSWIGCAWCVGSRVSGYGRTINPR